MNKNLQTFLLILIAASSLYLVFASRRIGRKLSKNAQRSTKEIAQQTSVIKRELGHLYHQIEALEQLLDCASQFFYEYFPNSIVCKYNN
jgi:hypothetical protein